MAMVQVFVGSPSDLPHLWSSTLLPELEQRGIDYRIHACSAHRNLRALIGFIDTTWRDTSVFVCAAGMAAALPGTVRGILLDRAQIPIYAIALPSDDFPDADDAITSIDRLPPGIDVIYGGVATEGFNSITGEVVADALACELPRTADPRIVKEPQFDIQPPWKTGD